MSKTLYLLRHAKAGPQAAGQRDHDRELTGRGRREAAALGSRSAADGELPELVIASTAVRAVQTAALWAKAAGPAGTAHHPPRRDLPGGCGSRAAPGPRSG